MDDVSGTRELYKEYEGGGIKTTTKDTGGFIEIGSDNGSSLRKPIG